MDQTIDEKISHYEALLEEMRDTGIELEVLHRKVKRERKEIEKLLANKGVNKLVEERIQEAVNTYLEEWEDDAVSERIGTEIDKLVDLMLGREFSAERGHEDLRPALATMFGRWIRELVKVKG